MKSNIFAVISFAIIASLGTDAAAQEPPPAKKTKQTSTKPLIEATVSKAVERVQMQTTLDGQKMAGKIGVSIGNLNDPSVGLDPGKGTVMNPPENKVFLMVTLDVLPMVGVTSKTGEIHLLEPNNIKQLGFTWIEFLSGWIPADGVETSYDRKRVERMMYAINKNDIPNLVFYFLGVKYKVSDYLPK